MELLSILLERWKVVLGFPFLGGIVAIVTSLLLPPLYTAGASFLPEGPSRQVDLPGGLGGIAAQFGIPLGGGGGESPEFYAALVESRTLRDEILLTEFPDPRAGGDAVASLVDILEIEGETLTERLERGREQLRGIVAARLNEETGIVSVSVETRYPTLSASIANTLLELVNRFNLETRQSRAEQRRTFVEQRVAEASEDLWEVEEELQRFLEQNRQWEGSPDLTFQHDRLQRRVSLKLEVLMELQRSYEQAQIQEVNNTPVITTIDRAVPPGEKSSPQRKLIVIMSVLVCGFVGVSWAFGAEFLERMDERQGDDYRELRSRWAAAKQELRGLLGRSRSDRNNA